MQSTYAVFAEPNRRRTLDELCQGERSAGELVERPSLSQPAVANHLRVPREVDRVASRVDEQHHNRLRPGWLAEIDACLAPYRRFWAERLDALHAHLDQEHV